MITKSRLANWISDVVGDETPFEVDRGYFIDHVRPRPGLPVFAEGWKDRLVAERDVNGCLVSYLSPVDLAICKLGANREKDIPFVKGMIERGMVTLNEIHLLLPLVDLPYRDTVSMALDGLVDQMSNDCEAKPSWWI